MVCRLVLSSILQCCDRLLGWCWQWVISIGSLWIWQFWLVMCRVIWKFCILILGLQKLVVCRVFIWYRDIGVLQIQVLLSRQLKFSWWMWLLFCCLVFWFLLLMQIIRVLMQLIFGCWLRYVVCMFNECGSMMLFRFGVVMQLLWVCCRLKFSVVLMFWFCWWQSWKLWIFCNCFSMVQLLLVELLLMMIILKFGQFCLQMLCRVFFRYFFVLKQGVMMDISGVFVVFECLLEVVFLIMCCFCYLFCLVVVLGGCWL